jgi:hypothetical protein
LTSDPPTEAALIADACGRVRDRLRAAVASGQIGQVGAAKTEAVALAAAVHPERKRLEKDVLLDVAELVRRAERAIGVAIRQGQEAGTVRDARGSKQLLRADGGGPLLSPRDFCNAGELSPGNGQAGVYTLTDGIPDEAFEAAIKEARAEGNLSRASVARKAEACAAERAARGGEWIPQPDDRSAGAPAQRRKLIGIWAAQGFTSPQIAGRLGIRDETVRKIARDCGTPVTADDTVRGRHRHDSTRIARETVHALEGLAMGTELIVPGDLDPAEAKDWAASLAESLRTLNRFARQIKENMPSERQA